MKVLLTSNRGSPPRLCPPEKGLGSYNQRLYRLNRANNQQSRVAVFGPVVVRRHLSRPREPKFRSGARFRGVTARTRSAHKPSSLSHLSRPNIEHLIVRQAQVARSALTCTAGHVSL